MSYPLDLFEFDLVYLEEFSINSCHTPLSTLKDISIIHTQFFFHLLKWWLGYEGPRISKYRRHLLYLQRYLIPLSFVDIFPYFAIFIWILCARDGRFFFLDLTLYFSWDLHVSLCSWFYYSKFYLLFFFGFLTLPWIYILFF